MTSRNYRTLGALFFALLLCAVPQPSRAQATGQSVAVVYTCPMHQEVKSKKKGSCPKCKMDLRPVRAEAAGAKVSAAHRSHAAPKPTFADVELLDQDGRKVHFYSDLVKGRTVAVQFIFTTCTTICPPLGATFARVQRELGERVGRDVYLISVSVDPVTDTPERLKAWGAKFKAGPGWTFVTGAKEQVDELLSSLGADVWSPSNHSPAVIIGNDAKGQWTRTYGLAPPATLVKLVSDAFEVRLASQQSDMNSQEQAQP